MSTQPSPVAVVTGASAGIGKAFVSRLLSRGHCCVAADVDADGLAALAANMGPSARLATLRVDVSSADDVERLADFAFAKFGHVDMIINNAGILSTGLSWEATPEEWRRLLDVNFFGVVHAVRSFVPRLRQQGHGHIVNIGSMASLTSGAMVGPYSASKHAVLALSECLARELMQVGSSIGVSVAFPGAVHTGIARSLAPSGGHASEQLDLALTELIARGMPADTLADVVLQAVAEGAFAIFPHPMVRDAARARLDHLLEGELWSDVPSEEL
jgi:NAD(P)-dependent dehydrogenase (short-subunit alcohol dehydrogenase family)